MEKIELIKVYQTLNEKEKLLLVVADYYSTKKKLVNAFMDEDIAEILFDGETSLDKTNVITSKYLKDIYEKVIKENIDMNLTNSIPLIENETTEFKMAYKTCVNIKLLKKHKQEDVIGIYNELNSNIK